MLEMYRELLGFLKATANYDEPGVPAIDILRKIQLRAREISYEHENKMEELIYAGKWPNE